MYDETHVCLYDVVADPGEHNNLVASKTDAAKEMLAVLQTFDAQIVTEYQAVDS